MKDRIKDIVKNNKVIFIIILIAIIAVMTVIIALIFNKDTYAIDNDKDYMDLTCNNNIVSAGDEIECSLSVNIATIKGQAFQSDIELSDGLSFVEFKKDKTCDGDNCWEITKGSEATVASLLTENTVSGLIPVGTFKYQVSENAAPGQEYTIRLTNAFIGGKDDNGDTQKIDFESLSSTVRVASNVNTLDNITLSFGTLNEEFKSDVNNYTATVDSEKISINVTKTDENSTIEGNLDNIGLHYGTNKIDIKVISESKVENVYTLNIYRPYEFSSDNYIYNKDNNYLYTKADSDGTTIISNISLPSGLTGKIEDNKLIIKYSDEELKSINLINVKINNYRIVENKIYVGKDLSYDDFNNNITGNGVITKIFDKDDNEITAGNLIDGYKFKVYYDTNLLEEYSIVEEYLDLSDLIIDDQNKIIKRVMVGTTVNDIRSSIDTSGTITITDSNNKALNDSSVIKTGNKLSIKLNNNSYTYTISVLGDLNGDGKIEINDVAMTYKKAVYKDKNNITKIQESAGDINNDANIKINDVAMLYTYLVNKKSGKDVKLIK